VSCSRLDLGNGTDQPGFNQKISSHRKKPAKARARRAGLPAHAVRLRADSGHVRTRAFY